MEAAENHLTDKVKNQHDLAAMGIAFNKVAWSCRDDPVGRRDTESHKVSKF